MYLSLYTRTARATQCAVSRCSTCTRWCRSVGFIQHDYYVLVTGGLNTCTWSCPNGCWSVEKCLRTLRMCIRKRKDSEFLVVVCVCGSPPVHLDHHITSIFG